GAEPRAGAGFKMSPEEYRAQIGKNPQVPVLQAASAWGGRAHPRNGAVLTDAELHEVIKAAQGEKGYADQLQVDKPEEFKRRSGKLAEYLTRTNEGARIMQLDTIEAYSMFIAHAAGET